MELDSCFATLTIAFVLLTTGTVCQSSSQGDEELQNLLIKRMDNLQDKLSDLDLSMQSLDSDLAKAIANCMGVQSDLCWALEVEAGMKSRQHMDSPWLPGKRSIPNDPETQRYRSLFKELKRKRAMVGHLMGVVRGANDVVKSERKKSCKLNLGFHCQTEEIIDFANMLDYLKSANSPGKKRSVGQSL